MSSVMYSFLEKYPVDGCNRILDRIAPVDVVSLAKFFPIAGISRKKNEIIVTYIVNPKSRFRGKAKTRVTVDRTSSTLRLVGKGDVSFEVRFNCTNDILTVYFVVTGKLIDMIPRDKAKSIFDEILNYVRVKAYEIGALQPEAPAPAAPPAPAPPVPAVQQQPVQPAAVEAQPAQTQPPPPPSPEPAVAQPAAEEATVVQQPQEEAAEAAAGVGEVQAEAAAVEQEGLSVTECMAKLITAGLPVDEELSRKIPFEYAPKFSLSPLVEMGEAQVSKLDLSKYRDGFMVRLSSGGARLDSLRLGGKVGVYLKVNGAEHLGSEAVWRAVNVYCTDPGKKVFYIVVRV